MSHQCIFLFIYFYFLLSHVVHTMQFNLFYFSFFPFNIKKYKQYKNKTKNPQGRDHFTIVIKFNNKNYFFPFIFYHSFCCVLLLFSSFFKKITKSPPCDLFCFLLFYFVHKQLFTKRPRGLAAEHFSKISSYILLFEFLISVVACRIFFHYLLE
jgi:hypothetical protein